MTYDDHLVSRFVHEIHRGQFQGCPAQSIHECAMEARFFCDDGNVGFELDVTVCKVQHIR